MMGEYVKRSDALQAVGDVHPLDYNGQGIVKRIKSIPAADVVEVRHGRWIDTEPNLPDWSHRKNGMAYYCSVCEHSAGKNKHNTYRWCPWCGAKMDGGPDDGI